MILFPAIDILEGRAVRLLRGERSSVTDYGTPLDRAKLWVEQGAEYLHVVDLGGAFDGHSNINETIYQISKLGVPIQSGGGLRSMEDIANRLSSGASRVVLGTLWHSNFDLALQALEKYGDRIVAGIDAKEGMLTINGWTETTDITAVAFGKRVRQMGVRYAVFTDVSKDGALQGVSLEETLKMQEESSLNVVASGGIADIEDLRRLKEKGLYGAILGRSIYEGTIDLSAAIREMKDAL